MEHGTPVPDPSETSDEIIRIISSDGTRYKADRKLLSSHSTVLEQLITLSAQTQTFGHRSIELPSASSAGLRHVVVLLKKLRNIEDPKHFRSAPSHMNHLAFHHSEELFEALIVADAYDIPAVLSLASEASRYPGLDEFFAFAVACASDDLTAMKRAVTYTLPKPLDDMPPWAERYLQKLHPERLDRLKAIHQAYHQLIVSLSEQLENINVLDDREDFHPE
jgi:hypothetical protein